MNYKTADDMGAEGLDVEIDASPCVIGTDNDSVGDVGKNEEGPPDNIALDICAVNIVSTNDAIIREELKTKWATSDLAHKGPLKYSRTERAGTPFELASNKELITKTVTDDEIKNAQQAIEKLA